MSTSPHSVGPEQTLATAHSMMREHHIRHLPVLHGGKLVGMLTERDVALIASMQGASEKITTVEDAMSSDVYSVTPDAPLDEVAAEMAEKKYGSTVVLQNGKIVGMFTTTDVCRALSELLHERLAK
ncbi:MAG: CBS domain-containing protein [Sandaracinaceae bacterium]|nr:CBS domain-containing protein [Sandaracinaceae bacterium]